MAAGQPNQGWRCDFMADALWSGCKPRTFNVTDDYSREALRIENDTSLPAARGDPGPERTGGYPWSPLSVRLDNGHGFIANALADRAASKGIGLNPIQPGKPAQNAYLVRFNKTYRVKQFPKLGLRGSGNRGGFTKLGLFNCNCNYGSGCGCGCICPSMNNMIR